MCGRFVALSDPDGLARFFVVDERKSADLPPNPNVAPTEDVHAVVDHLRRRVLVTFRWGLVPRWAEHPRVGPRMINARVETIAEKPAFREAFERRRCLIPAAGFYEWRTEADGAKTPFFIHRPDGAPLALAGLWEVWRDPGGQTVLRTCTIITTAATGAIAALHDRTPVVLRRAHWDAWLDREMTDPVRLRSLLDEGEQAVLAYYQVSRGVNDARNKDPALPLAEPGSTRCKNPVSGPILGR